MASFSIPFPFWNWLHSVGLTWIPEALTIHTYALCIMLGILLAGVITARRLNRRGVESGYVVDISVWAVLLGIVGARVFHVVTHPGDYFGEGRDPWAIVRIWDGGIAIFGAIIAGAIGIYIASRMIGLRFSAFADALAPGLLVAQAFGRLGNWFNQELYGTPTTLPWGLEIDATNAAYPVGLPEGILFHPTFLYEFVWNILGAIVLIMIDKKSPQQWGKLIGGYLIWYGAGRAVWETIRLDPSESFFGIRTNVWMAIFAIILGVLIILVQRARHAGLEPSPWLPGHEGGPDAGVESEERYTEREESDDPVSSTQSVTP
ncbi:prolipoprotein diacylglyceryl transferase [Humidisolicoccus flavus]|uniref:prolipoprotein diacylglyceryl transferase n=1 Tax=Humidisolicoccus flavus TaxID=3111414 RepID=UPI003D2FD789